MLQRRWILNASAGALLAGAVGAPVAAWAQLQDVNDAINKAGRQRMLSQRMAKFYLASMLPVDAATASTEITKARTEFLSAMGLLRNAPEATPRIKDELLLADGQWVFFDSALKKVQAGGSTKPLQDVFVSSENLLSVMDRVTGLYSAIKV
jgi:hypothetical protein